MCVLGIWDAGGRRIVCRLLEWDGRLAAWLFRRFVSDSSGGERKWEIGRWRFGNKLLVRLFLVDLSVAIRCFLVIFGGGMLKFPTWGEKEKGLTSKLRRPRQWWEERLVTDFDIFGDVTVVVWCILVRFHRKKTALPLIFSSPSVYAHSPYSNNVCSVRLTVQFSRRMKLSSSLLFFWSFFLLSFFPTSFWYSSVSSVCVDSYVIKKISESVWVFQRKFLSIVCVCVYGKSGLM